jgi:formamidopyrimidine-DNA glycosylase
VPELPDVEVFKRYVDATALHQTIARVDVYDAKILRGTSKRSLEKSLRKRKFQRTDRHGKYLGLQLDSEPWLVLHFGMTGEPRYFKNEGTTPKHTRLRVSFSNGYHLAYVNQRRLGTVQLADDFARFVSRQGLGPDALAFDRQAFGDLFSASRGTVKTLLMKQEAIAGVGNIYADEALFQAGIHPTTRPAQLDEKTIGRLYQALRHVLRTAIDRQVDPGAFPKSWLLPRREKDGRCPRSHGPLKLLKVSGRTTYFCPKCQPKRRG